MNRSWIDQIKKSREMMSQYWGARSKKQKWIFIGAFLFLVAALSTFILISSHPQYVPLYSGQLSDQEVGDIKAELDKEGYSKYKLSDAGTMLLVPKKDAPNLVVTLASKGYPKDNSINYDVFGSNLSFGATDRQYDILQQQAMQTQVADILKHVDGIQDAQVILTLPQSSVFVKQDDQPKATASVMVDVAPGVNLDSGQIQALYTLVSHSVPNLPVDNITIMNQYSEMLTLQSSADQVVDKYDEQRKVQQEVEQDIQQNLQSLLGTVLGTNNVFVQTYVKLNFDQEKTTENLVKPTDNNNDGIIISSQKDTKSSSGTGSSAGGTTGTGSTDVPGYTGTDNSGNSSSDEDSSTINYEVNRINNVITKSPYQIEDITINVGVEPNSPNSSTLSKATQASVRNIASNVVLTALGHPNLSQQQINSRITIFPHKFAASPFQNTAANKTNWLLLALAIVAGLLLIGGIIWFILSRRRDKDGADLEPLRVTAVPSKESDYFAEEELSVENQLKKLLAQRPDDFSKVIRTWLNEEES